MSPDFDFRDRKGHYRGHGMRGLVALAIDRLPRAALFGSCGVVFYKVGPWLLHAVLGH